MIDSEITDELYFSDRRLRQRLLISDLAFSDNCLEHIDFILSQSKYRHVNVDNDVYIATLKKLQVTFKLLKFLNQHRS